MAATNGIKRRALSNPDPASIASFTMVELLVVLVLIATLATMIIPRLSGFSDSTRLRESVQSILMAARYARNFAITHRCQSQLMIDTKNNRYAVSYQVDPEHRPAEFMPIRRSGLSKSLAPGIRFSSVSVARQTGVGGEVRGMNESGSDAIIFSPTGTCDGAIVHMGNEKQIYTLLIWAHSGRAELHEGRVDALPNDRFDLDV